jgi:hypothetical protein
MICRTGGHSQLRPGRIKDESCGRLSNGTLAVSPVRLDRISRTRAAEGYLDQGMPLEANAELQWMDACVRHVPEVLAVRVAIYRRLERWELDGNCCPAACEVQSRLTKVVADANRLLYTAELLRRLAQERRSWRSHSLAFSTSCPSSSAAPWRFSGNPWRTAGGVDNRLRAHDAGDHEPWAAGSQ